MTTQIASVLVANRGEIALRVFRTCRKLGIGTVAVFSDPDANAPHVRAADRAVRLPGHAAADTYLRADLLVAAAKAAAADAIHPGYGFLSENADFARAVLDAGLTWIGPPPDAIAAMADKLAAKRRMSAAGVTVLAELDPFVVTSADVPVLVKASAGGGGHGMRVVTELGELAGALEAASGEAQAAFGDPTVFCESYLPAGHHIEVQVVADEHGTVWAVGERECSIQRRHQKLVEEAPSPLVERISGLRARLFDAALVATRAVGYRGAGTVEFLVDDSGRFFFLEMNTRLQVEHPVTECTTNVDLVALQLAVAEGQRLPEQPPRTSGHAIEVRLYAEDPTAGWAPQTGLLHDFDVPNVDVRFDTATTSVGLRLDAGIATGSVVMPHYDALLAKLIAWAPDRRTAARRLSADLARARLHGVGTNRDLLVRVLQHPGFVAGETDTAFLRRHGVLPLAQPLLADLRSAAVAAALAVDAAQRQQARVLAGVRSGWRNVVSAPQLLTLDGPGGRQEVRYRITRSALELYDGGPSLELVDAHPHEVVLAADGVRQTFAVARHGDDVFVDTATGGTAFRVVPRFPERSERVVQGALVAPLPGVVQRLAVAVGDPVAPGQPVLWLEAMKMRHRVDAPAGGVVERLPVEVGQQVDAGTVLAVVRVTDGEPADAEEA